MASQLHVAVPQLDVPIHVSAAVAPSTLHGLCFAYTAAESAILLCVFSQVIIQLRKFAQAAKRIKAAVGSEASAPQIAKAVSKGEVKPGDLSEILSTDIRGGMDTSILGTTM